MKGFGRESDARPAGPKGQTHASVMSDDSGLAGAVSELHKQHPIKYNDLGPHHGADHHVRHLPIAGLKDSQE